MNAETSMNPLVARFVPPVAAVLAIALFVSLGFWQLDRAAQKEALAARFAEDAPFRPLADVRDPVPFQRIRTRGTLLGDRQVLIDNIVRNGRLGYYVITPLQTSRNDPLLLVNRGWVARDDVERDAVDLSLAEEPALVEGRAGSLPRVGVRGGPGFAASGGEWPKIAVYPTAEEVGAELGRALLPFTLLLDEGDPRGFDRDWQPTQSGPMMHYGYALQWFAMALGVVVISLWLLRKRGLPGA